MAPSLLFVTRKYPPARGGMEEFSVRLFEAYPGSKELVALRRGQRWLPLFAVRALYAAWRGRKTFEHVHLGDGMMALLGPAFHALSRRPVTITVHGQEVTRRLPVYQPMLRRGLRSFVGGVVAVSSYTARETASLHGIQAAVITNGVDVERFSQVTRAGSPRDARIRLGLPPDGSLIVTVGRLVERKGAAWFIRNVMARLDDDVIYVVVGDGPDRANVERAAGGDPRVVVLGDVPGPVVDALYSCADLFVAPNVPVPRKPEGYGIAPAEAAAAGLPVLVSALEGLADMAADTGVPTVPAGDAEAWVDAVRHALADPAHARAKSPPRSWSLVAEDYARVFAAAGEQLRLRRNFDRARSPAE